MKSLYYLTTCICLLIAACNNASSDKPVTATPDSAPKKDSIVTQPAPTNAPKEASEGDFDGDGKKEKVWLVPPAIDSSGTDCVNDDCTSYLKFSDSAIPTIAVKQCIGGLPINHGDLNGDQSDEIGLLPDWFSSCWSGYHVYTLKTGKWVAAVPDFSTYCDQWEKGVIPIEKDSSHPGHVIIRYSEMDNATADIVLKEKSVVVR